MTHIAVVTQVDTSVGWDRVVLRLLEDNTVVETLLTDPRFFRRIRPMDLYEIEIAPKGHPREIRFIERVVGDVKL